MKHLRLRKMFLAISTSSLLSVAIPVSAQTVFDPGWNPFQQTVVTNTAINSNPNVNTNTNTVAAWPFGSVQGSTSIAIAGAVNVPTPSSSHGTNYKKSYVSPPVRYEVNNYYDNTYKNSYKNDYRDITYKRNDYVDYRAPVRYKQSDYVDYRSPVTYKPSVDYVERVTYETTYVPVVLPQAYRQYAVQQVHVLPRAGIETFTNTIASASSSFMKPISESSSAAGALASVTATFLGAGALIGRKFFLA